MKPTLTTREQKILWATVERYIATAEPVGSRVLSQEYKLDISTATIRHVLNALDRSGLLIQPHTSAGRVPSDFGYRVYVDELLPEPKPELVESVKQALSKIHPDRYGNLHSILRRVSQILASLSGCVAMVTSPNMQIMRIKSIQLLTVDADKLMVIVMGDSLHTSSSIVTLPEAMVGENLEQELDILQNFLNYHLQGKPWVELSNLPWAELDQQFQAYGLLLDKCLQQLAHIPLVNEQIFISGLSELLRQPEFQQPQQVQGVIYILESEQACLLPLLNANTGGVQIGAEMGVDYLHNCALVSSPYYCDRQPVGTVGVLNATRMNYAKSIACVETAANHLTEVVSQW
jgi:heat-inducible transcriptional repressor